MSTKSLPERPSLALKLQAKELQRLHRERRIPAAARVAGLIQERGGKSAAEL